MTYFGLIRFGRSSSFDSFSFDVPLLSEEHCGSDAIVVFVRGEIN